MKSAIAIFTVCVTVFFNNLSATDVNDAICTNFHVYKKFWPNGFFVSDNALAYSIQENLIKSPTVENDLISKEMDKHKIKQEEAAEEISNKEKEENDIKKRLETMTIEVNLNPALNVLNLLSENHWIALNKRNLGNATAIAKAMGRVIASNTDVLEHDGDALFSYITQISMSDDGPSPCNSEKYLAALDLAKYVLNTPLLPVKYSFSIIDDIDLSKGIGNEKLATISETSQNRTMLSRQNEFADIVFNHVCSKHPTQKEFLVRMLSSEQNKYSRFLMDIYEYMGKDSMQKYSVVDRGQTSGPSRNTCFFNSVFFHDQKAGNIPSTKDGSLSKASNYVAYLEGLYKQIPEYKDYKEDLGINDMIKNISTISSDHGADAMHSFSGTVHNHLTAPNERIFPGEIDGCSIIEMASASLKFNVAFFSSNVERPQGNTNSLLRHYSGGFFYSAYVPIVPISFTYTSNKRVSYGHARSLVKK